MERLPELTMLMLDRLEDVSISFWDEELRLLYMSEQSRKWAERPTGEMLGQRYIELFPDRKGMEDVLKRVLDGEDVRDKPDYVVDGDGSVQHLVQDVFTMKFDGRKLLVLVGRGVTKVVEAKRRHVTAVGRAKKRLRREKKRLEAERNRLSKTILGAPTAVALVEGPDHKVVMMNSMFQELFGGRIEEGMTVRRDFSPKGHPETEVHLAIMDSVAKTGKPFSAKEQSVVYDWHGTGVSEERIFDIVYQPILGSSEEVSRIAMFGNDITELVRARKTAQEAARVRDEYMSVASHELRTPLAGIMLQVDLLLRSHDLTPEVRSGVERIQKQGKRLTDMVSTLLDVSRLSRGDIPVFLETVNLKTVTQEVVSRLKLDAEQAQCEVICHLEDALGQWDPARLDQVVTNLLTNAVKYGPRAPIIVTVSAGETAAKLSVKDYGIGIPPEEVGSLFEQFRRGTKQHANSSGLGLGLWIVKRIVEKLGGTVEVTSTLGEGSTFTVELPFNRCLH